MAVAQVVDARVNPSNTAQRIILWGNGRIDVRGGAAITDGPQYFDRVDQPVVTAIWVTNWASNPWQGYILDKQGAFHPFGGAPTMGTQRDEWGPTKAGEVQGVPYWYEGIYLDWSWDPNNAGRGVVLDGYGTLHPFGGAPTPPRATNRWSNPTIACRFEMDWAGDTLRAYTLDRFGGIHADYSAVTIPASAGAPYWPGRQAARHLQITKWTSPAAGYTVDVQGGVHNWGGAAPAFGGPYMQSGDWARVMRVLNPADPLRLWQVWAGGQEYEWTASTAPTVTAGGIALVSPAASVTGTTRPMLTWDYSDPQRDSQAAWELFVFTEAFAAGHNMGNPAVHAASAVVAQSGIQATVRGIASPVDFANGSYRLYVRARDTAGQWSAWDSHNWTQNITPPSTPTGMSASANEGSFSVALSVSATTGQSAKLVRFERSVGGGPWLPVRGADAVPLVATTRGTDWDAPLGVPCAYRAVAYAVDPRTASAPSASDDAALSTRTYVVTAVGDPALGGRLSVQEPVAWSRPVVAGVFEPLGSEYPTVVSDGVPRSRRSTLHLVSLDADEWARIRALVEADRTLVYRDPFGGVRYCRIVGDWSQELMPGAALRHMHTTEMPLVEVRPPHLAA